MLRTTRLYDALLRVRNSSSGAVTSTGRASLAFKPVQEYEFKMVIQIQSVDVTTGDEAYTFNVQVSADNSTFYTVASKVVAAGAASITTFEIPLSGFQVESVLSSPAYIAVQHVLAGTTPSINYDAWIMPL